VAEKFGKNAKDTGSVAVQVALLTQRINTLAPHFESHAKDFAGKRGLMKMIGKRKGLLRYLQNRSEEQYQQLIKELGLRK